MLDIDALWWPMCAALAVALCAALLAAVMAGAARGQLKQMRLSQTALEADLGSLQQQLLQLAHRHRELLQGASGVTERLTAVEHRCAELAGAIADAATPGTERYSEALSLLASGADRDSVASQCGLSTAEAQLMVLVRNRTGRSTSRLARHE